MTPENGNKYSSPKFTDHETEIIEQIIITLAIMLDNIIKDYKNPEQTMKDYLEINSSETNLLRVFTALILGNINNERGMYLGEIREEISKLLYKKSQEDFLANSANLSKVLKEFGDIEITFSITGKKKIKELSPKSTVGRKPKVRMYQEEGPEGPPVVKKLTDTVEDYKKILSNPQALHFINNKLIKYAKLEEAYNLIVDNAFSFFKKGNEDAYKFLDAFKVLFHNDTNAIMDTNTMPDRKLFREAINSRTEQELEELKEQFVRHLMENPSNSVFFIFSLAKFAVN
jgi:hypothetical protein